MMVRMRHDEDGDDGVADDDADAGAVACWRRCWRGWGWG
jgi:hypothetical protein